MLDGRWLISGGAGYIGAHVVRALLASGRDVVVLDDLSAGMASRLPDDVQLIRQSVLDEPSLKAILRAVKPVGVIHLAAKKSPAHSVADPLLYARENVGAVLSLLGALRESTATRILFASSASVYGVPDVEFIDEDASKSPVNPYGESKLYCEHLLRSAAAAYGLGVINLRCFNVVGAGSTKLQDTGADNLVPRIFQAMRTGVSPRVFGGDYNTPDGTCVRDYVDVEDVAEAYVLAAARLESEACIESYNVGRGVGSSVLEVLDAVGAVTGRPLSYEILDRRPGDPARAVSGVERIERELGWSAKRGLAEMLRSAWLAKEDVFRSTG